MNVDCGRRFNRHVDGHVTLVYLKVGGTLKREGEVIMLYKWVIIYLFTANNTELRIFTL